MTALILHMTGNDVRWLNRVIRKLSEFRDQNSLCVRCLTYISVSLLRCDTFREGFGHTLQHCSLSSP